jgi:hypothetical protein
MESRQASVRSTGENFLARMPSAACFNVSEQRSGWGLSRGRTGWLVRLRWRREKIAVWAFPCCFLPRTGPRIVKLSKKRPIPADKLFRERFPATGEDILDVAASGDSTLQDVVIVMDRQGGMRMLDPSGWSLPALSAEYGATAVYKVEKRGLNGAGGRLGRLRALPDPAQPFVGKAVPVARHGLLQLSPCDDAAARLIGPA